MSSGSAATCRRCLHSQGNNPEPIRQLEDDDESMMRRREMMDNDDENEVKMIVI